VANPIVLPATPSSDPARSDVDQVERAECAIAAYTNSSPLAGADTPTAGPWVEVGVGRTVVASMTVAQISSGATLDAWLETAASSDGSDPYGPRPLGEHFPTINAAASARRSLPDRYVRIVFALPTSASAQLTARLDLGP